MCGCLTILRMSSGLGALPVERVALRGGDDGRSAMVEIVETTSLAD